MGYKPCGHPAASRALLDSAKRTAAQNACYCSFPSIIVFSFRAGGVSIRFASATICHRTTTEMVNFLFQQLTEVGYLDGCVQYYGYYEHYQRALSYPLILTAYPHPRRSSTQSESTCSCSRPT